MYTVVSKPADDATDAADDVAEKAAAEKPEDIRYLVKDFKEAKNLVGRLRIAFPDKYNPKNAPPHQARQKFRRQLIGQSKRAI